VSPEAAAGGPIAFVRDGDLIEIDVDDRRLELLVDFEEFDRRREGWKAPALRVTSACWGSTPRWWAAPREARWCRPRT